MTPSNPARLRERLRQSSRQGFSLLEMFLLVAVIGLFTTVAINMIGTGFPGALRSAKIEADVAKLNQLIRLYLADGGTLNGITSEQAVLDHLKRARASADAISSIGIASGRLIDVRLRVRSNGSSKASGQKYRARWNPGKKQFDLVTSGNGIDEFYLDESLSAASFPVDTRSGGRKKLNTSKGWVWGDTATNPTASYLTPTTTTASVGNNGFDPEMDFGAGGGGGSGGSSGGGSGGSGGSGGGSGGSSGSGGTTTTQLPPPTIDPTGGAFAYAAFPTSAAISSNGAPVGGSSIVYRVNGGAWQTYSSSISLVSGTTLEAKNISVSPLLFTDSPITAQSYYRYVSGFTGHGDGTWTNVTGGPTLEFGVTGSDGDSTLTHGSTELDLQNGEVIKDGVPNVMAFDSQNFSSVQANTGFRLGELTLVNGNTYNSSEATAATLRLNLNFAEPALARVVDVNFRMNSTPNDGPTRLSRADSVEILNPSPLTVTIDGVSYTLQLSWVTLDPGAGVVQGNLFHVFEGASAKAELRAKLVPNQ